MTECQGCGAWNDASRTLCVLCGTPLAETDEWDAAAELGPLLRDLSIALEAETGCLKTYVMQFSEAEGFAHLHFHLVPRMPDQPAEHRGPRVFAHLGHPESSRVTESARDDLALRLRARLTVSSSTAR